MEKNKLTEEHYRLADSGYEIIVKGSEISWKLYCCGGGNENLFYQSDEAYIVDGILLVLKSWQGDGDTTEFENSEDFQKYFNMLSKWNKTKQYVIENNLGVNNLVVDC